MPKHASVGWKSLKKKSLCASMERLQKVMSMCVMLVLMLVLMVVLILVLMVSGGW